MRIVKYYGFYIVVTLVIFVSPTIAGAQTTKWEDVAGRSGLESGYNKFEDYSIVRTKRNVVRGVVGKGSVFDPFANERVLEIVAAFSHKGQKISNSIDEVYLIIMPKASSNFGKIFQGLEEKDDKGRFYISPDSKVIALVDGERLELGRVSKSGKLNVWGEYTGNAFIAVELTDFRKLAAAKKVELAIGRIEIKFPKRNFFNRLRLLVDELDARSK